MAYVHADAAVGPAALARAAGGPTLTLATGKGAAFAAANPTPSSPMPVAIFRGPAGSEALQGAVLVTGVSGDALTCAGNVPGYVDPAVQVGDVAACVPLAADEAALWAAIATCVTSTALATTLGDYATTAALNAGLAGKQGSLTLTTTGTSGAATLVGSTLNIPQYAGGGGGSGTVTTVSVASANGLGGSVANATTTPAITLTCSIVGILKGNGTAVSQAVAVTDYVSPSGLSSALASYVALTGAQTLVDKSTQSSGSGDQLKHLNTLGVQASGVDADGNAGGYDLSYLLASGVDLAAGASASRIATWPGKILEILIKANVNGASGGFTLVVTKNGTTIATQAVVASNTAVVTIAAGSISDLAIAKGDVFAASCASSPAPGTGVQSVEVYIKHGRRNR